MPARILVVNAGSSSLKLRLLDTADEVVERLDLPALEPGSDALEQLTSAVRGLASVDAVGHRVVHGGAEFGDSVLVTDEVVERLRPLSELASLHNPAALAALEAVRAALPRIPSVACFDTAFHRSLPEVAATYAVPHRWTEEWGIRRYGFHGLSHSYASRRTAELLDRSREELRIVTCHLGAGASLAAVVGGQSVDTTMGFTPMEGLVMATRSGSIDPGILTYVQRRHGLDGAEVERILEEESGVLGLSGRSSDMRVIEQAAEEGDAAARLALDIYVYRLRAGIAAMVAAMGGVDAITFTGGVGEGSAIIREAACVSTGYLGVALDASRNAEAAHDDRMLSTPDSGVKVVLVHAREDIEVAREVRKVLAT